MASKISRRQTKRGSFKKTYQDQLRCQLGLIVDKPKPGFGSSNDGNTARTFFLNSVVVANICQIDIRLIQRFHIILQTLSCIYDIDSAKFGSYATETAELCVSLYPWYPMPTSVHRVLLHGSVIIASFCVPIGLLSEEAQEARNKDIKRFRLNFALKTSRLDNLTDILNRLLVSSDPIISSFRKIPPKSSKSLFPEAINLLKTPDISLQSNISITELHQLNSDSSSDEE